MWLADDSPFPKMPLSSSPQSVSVRTALHDRGDFARVIKLRILWREDYPGSSRWTQCNHMAVLRRRQEGPRQRGRGDNASRGQRERFEGTGWLAWKGRKGPQVGKGRQPLEAAKGKEIDSRASRKNTALLVLQKPWLYVFLPPEV